MPTASPGFPALILACLLAACGSEPDTTDADSSGTATTGSPTTGQNTDPTTTGDASTGDITGAGTNTGQATSTGADSTGEATTGEATTGDDPTGATSTGTTGATTGDTSTGDAGGPGQAALDTAEALEVAVDGVYFSSESDYLWTVFVIADAAPVTEANVKEVIAEVYVPHSDPPLADRAVELRTFAAFMDPLTVMYPEDYQPIRDIFEDQLINVQVFRLGEQFGNDLMGAIDVFVIGETADGDLVGMFTISVET